MFKKLFSLAAGQDQQAAKDEQTYRNILHDAAQMGGTLFGPIPEGNRREFFCLNRHTWIWHEEWTDANGIRHARTTRYDIRPHGIFKAQDGMPYQPLSVQEAHHFYAAMRAYQKNIHAKFDPYITAAPQPV